MNNCSNLLIVFTRYPEPGQVKTRLIPALGEEGAAELQQQMTRQTLQMAVDLANNFPVRVEVHFAGGDIGKMQQMFGAAFTYLPQSAGDLGTRMLNSCRRAFQLGCSQVIIIGTDCPGISRELLARAFAGLEAHELVLGPALDGGYYLIGLKQPRHELFDNMPWGTAAVLLKTRKMAEELNLSVLLLEPLKDIDQPVDL